MRSCQKISKLSSVSLERPISFAEKTELKLHLLICRHCRIFHRNNQILSNIVKNYDNLDDKTNNIQGTE